MRAGTGMSEDTEINSVQAARTSGERYAAKRTTENEK